MTPTMRIFTHHYSDFTMSAMASQITSVSIVCLTVCPGADQRKHQSSASMAFVKGIHQWPNDSLTKGQYVRANHINQWNWEVVWLVAVSTLSHCLNHCRLILNLGPWKWIAVRFKLKYDILHLSKKPLHEWAMTHGNIINDDPCEHNPVKL